MRKSIWENEAKQLMEILQGAGETNVDYSYFYRWGWSLPHVQLVLVVTTIIGEATDYLEYLAVTQLHLLEY